MTPEDSPNRGRLRSPRARALGASVLIGALTLLIGGPLKRGGRAPATSEPAVPQLFFEYSWGLDAQAPRRVEPEVLSADQLELIDRIPAYRAELIARLPSFQDTWDRAAPALLATTVELARQPFERSEYSVAVFVNPRLPSMGTPLSLNLISFLETPVPDIPALEEPLPLFLFVALTHHELLHKYVDAILARQPSRILAELDPELLEGLPRPELLGAHLHLFALQERVLRELGLAQQLPWIRAQDALFGVEYTRAWELVREGDLGDRLVVELAPRD